MLLLDQEKNELQAELKHIKLRESLNDDLFKDADIKQNFGDVNVNIIYFISTIRNLKNLFSVTRRKQEIK